jgi:hypothetical protein
MFCSKCGASADGKFFCPSCGNAIVGTEAARSVAARKSWLWLLLYAAIGVGLVALIVVFGSMYESAPPSFGASKPTREDAANLACEMVAKQSGAEVLTLEKNDDGKAGVMVTMTIKTAEPRRYKARCLFTDNDGSGKIKADIVDLTEQP